MSDDQLKPSERGPTNDEPDFDQIFEEVKGYTARSSDYHFGHADKENHFQTAREVIAEALAVPADVEDAARWIIDKSGDWTNLAKANAQKLAEYALRGKQ